MEGVGLNRRGKYILSLAATLTDTAENEEKWLVVFFSSAQKNNCFCLQIF